MRRQHRCTGRLPVAFALTALAGFVLSGCINAGSASDSNTVAMIPGYAGGGVAAQPAPQGYTAPKNIIQVTLGDTSATQMFIHLSQPYARRGRSPSSSPTRPRR